MKRIKEIYEQYKNYSLDLIMYGFFLIFILILFIFLFVVPIPEQRLYL